MKKMNQKKCDEDELRVDGGRDSNLVPEDEQQLEERKYIFFFGQYTWIF